MKMKRILAVLLCAVMLIPLAACGRKSAVSDDTKDLKPGESRTLEFL